MKIILYGAGKIGEETYRFLESQGIAECVQCFCDKKREGTVLNTPVLSYDEAKSLDIPFVITVYRKSASYEEIRRKLAADKQIYYRDIVDFEVNALGYDKVKINRDYCGYFHMTNMDIYFDSAESQDALDMFWSERCVFKTLFKRLELENVVELACGRGRHVPQYIDNAGHITLVDILEKNIELCRERFQAYPNISYYKNNGKDLEKLPDSTYTSLFTYDAMVHFELIDIYSYLRETYRILLPGGYALFHHSNNTADYRDSFRKSSNISGRSFMSKDIFGYLADRAGFEIVEQHLLDWNQSKNLDCVSLVQKLPA